MAEIKDGCVKPALGPIGTATESVGPKAARAGGRFSAERSAVVRGDP